MKNIPKIKNIKKFAVSFLLCAIAAAFAICAGTARAASAGRPKRAIIIVPGIAGSELVAAEDFSGLSGIKKGDLVWLPEDLRPSLIQKTVDRVSDGSFFRDRKSYRKALDMISDAINAVSALLMDSAGQPLYKLNGKNVSPDDAYVGTLGTYTEIYKALYDEYGGDRDVVFFSYDWRQSVLESAEKLQRFIDAKGYDSVTFVSHSMGGTVTAHYLSMSRENRARTDKVISIGAPYSGSPKSLYVLQTGGFTEVSVLDGIFKRLSVNMPSVYELLPHRNTVESGYGYIRGSDGNMLDYEQTQRFILESGWNNNLYRNALSAVRELYPGGKHIMNSADIDAYIIAGWNVDTICSLTASEAAETSKSGDGTVPLSSAVLTDGEYFDHPIYLVNSVEHTELMSDSDVIKLVKSIIENRGSADKISYEYPKITAPSDIDRKTLGIAR